MPRRASCAAPARDPLVFGAHGDAAAASAEIGAREEDALRVHVCAPATAAALCATFRGEATGACDASGGG